MASESCLLASHGASVLDVTRTTGQDPDEGTIVNQVVCDTQFDFDSVRLLLVSHEIKCFEKPGHAYVNVVLFTEKPVPLMVSHLFYRQRQPDNDLKDWAFINRRGEIARHHIDISPSK